MKPSETELSPKPDQVSLFGNTAEKPFSPPAVSSDLFREKPGPPLPRAPAPSESSYFRAQLFPPAMRTLALLAWPCRADTSLLWESVEGEASKVYHQRGRRGWRAALASSGGPSDLRGLPAEAGLVAGEQPREEGTVWISPSTVELHRSLGAGGPPSLLPQAPGVREQQSVTIWLPFGDPWLFSAQLQHVGEGRVLLGLVFL